MFSSSTMALDICLVSLGPSCAFCSHGDGLLALVIVSCQSLHFIISCNSNGTVSALPLDSRRHRPARSVTTKLHFHHAMEVQVVHACHSSLPNPRKMLSRAASGACITTFLRRGRGSDGGCIFIVGRWRLLVVDVLFFNNQSHLCRLLQFTYAYGGRWLLIALEMLSRWIRLLRWVLGCPTACRGLYLLRGGLAVCCSLLALLFGLVRVGPALTPCTLCFFFAYLPGSIRFRRTIH
ncbi:hypothetical protein BCR44DRAFT_322843 [Catenaria anguillulae PL171]|uniref:Uncharacterized protein n=1 Tax=Catenaria anguillulae PL171 TaxID=765915 RepID=A0A1Y2H597_9FUNG|nr:hypothetical protein BCR44DRAFT_322843 [Catenaria anguillulae PL171]